MDGNIYLIFCLVCLHLPIGLCRGDATPDVNCGEWHAIFNGYDGQKQVSFCQAQLSRDEGFIVCQDKGASLLSISDFTYKEKLWEFFNKTSQLSVPYWVGLYFDHWGGQWMWPDHQNYNPRLVRWRDGEPNNSSGNEMCADLRRVGGDFVLTDNNCAKPQYFMCERTVPEDATSPTPTTTTAATTTTTTPISSTTPITSTTPLPTPTTKPRSARYCFTDVTVQPTQVTGDDQSRTATCPPMTAGGLQWPETAAGDTARVRCTNGEGEAEWQCGQNPVCWLGQPNLVPCASRQFRDLLEKTARPLTTAEAVGVAGNLERVTAGSGVSSADIAVATQVISGLGALQSQTQDRTQVPAIVTSVARVGSNLVSDQSLDTWNGMASEERLQSATDLLVALETTAAALSSRLDSPTVLRQADNNLDMQVQVVNPSLLAEGLHYASTNNSGSFRIPTANLRHSPDGLSRAVFMTHFRMATILGGEGGGRSPNLTSSVLSANLPSDTPTVLREPVTFTLRHAKDLKKDAPVMCVFWKIIEGERGYWSQEGCTLVSSNSSHTTCQCNHLTNFAILLDIHGVELTKTHSDALWYITLVGCIISLIALFISFLTFTFVSSLQGERNSIHQNLAVCLFVTELVFLAGISRTSDRVGCGVVAGLLHYFLLASFTWMFLEGLHIIFMLVQVFDAAKSRVKYYCLAGYGIPFVIVLISIASFHEGYGTDKHCWLTTENMFILSFALPAAIILSVNAIILTFAIVKVCQHSEFVFTAKDKGSPNYRGWLQGAAGMEVLLGITWILGYFFINHQTLAFAYLFTILNSLQGLFIFIFHCLLNKKVRKEYARNLGCGPDTGSTATSRFWSRKPSTSDTMPGSSQSQSA